jgi:dTMP kinase
MKRGKFIVIDGIDGCGKSTIALKIATHIFNKNKTTNVFITREPYNSKYAPEITTMLKESDDAYANAEIFADLFIKDRHIHTVWIEKELAAGHHVICNRYKYSMLAYQQTQGIPLKKLIEMHEGMLVPDLVIIPDISVETALHRIAADTNKSFKEVFVKDRKFQEKLQQNFLNLPKQLSEENIVILTGETSNEIFEKSKPEIDKIIQDKTTLLL